MECSHRISYEVTLRLGKQGRVWLSDKLHYKERKLEEEKGIRRPCKKYNKGH